MIYADIHHIVFIHRVPDNPRPEICAPSLPGGRHPLYPSFSDAIEIRYDSDKGRIVRAEEDINLGDIIMVERPNTLFFCPDSDKVRLICEQMNFIIMLCIP